MMERHLSMSYLLRERVPKKREIRQEKFIRESSFSLIKFVKTSIATSSHRVVECYSADQFRKLENLARWTLFVPICWINGLGLAYSDS